MNGWPVFNQTVETPSVLKQPKAAAAGGAVTFTATAGGTPGPVAVWEISYDGGASWQRADHQPVTKRTDEGSYRSTLEVSSGTYSDAGLLVRAVFRNAHGKAATDAVGFPAPPGR
ncbi:hypothetical protein [Arthrobacter sp. SD76]|uniref:hypothetical protein n=1 Tax=Arthrobacter sp. SD76 TaxID=3415007 RepID=UPI003C736319